MHVLLRPVRVVPFGDDGQQWLERCAVLRANPAAIVLVRVGDELHHDCVGGRSAELTFDDGGAVRPGLAFCVTCRRVGVVWEAAWLPPEDVRVRVDGAVLAYDAAQG